MSTDQLSRLPLVEISGKPYEVGVKLGHIGAPARTALTETTAWKSVMALRHDGRVRAMLDHAQARFPHHVEELRGLAEGIELPFEDVFAWNCRGDLWAMAPDGCTTVLLPGPRRTIAHNEDGLPALRGYCALVHVVSDEHSDFTAFVYPGSLPGHTFAVNGAGLVMTVNNIRSRDAAVGVPRMVLTRGLLGCADIDAALALVGQVPRAGAFHLSLAQSGDPRLFSVEFTSKAVSAVEVEAPTVHSNHLIHEAMAREHQFITRSSACRQERGSALLTDQTAAIEPLKILRDRDGSELPIRRDDADDPDDENTLATATFRIDDRGVEWSVYDRATGPALYTGRT